MRNACVRTHIIGWMWSFHVCFLLQLWTNQSFSFLSLLGNSWLVWPRKLPERWKVGFTPDVVDCCHKASLKHQMFLSSHFSSALVMEMPEEVSWEGNQMGWHHNRVTIKWWSEAASLCLVQDNSLLSMGEGGGNCFSPGFLPPQLAMVFMVMWDPTVLIIWQDMWFLFL